MMDITGWEFAYVPTKGARRAHDTPAVGDSHLFAWSNWPLSTNP